MRSRIVPGCALAALMSGAIGAAASSHRAEPTSTCASLASLKLPATTIAAAEEVATAVDPDLTSFAARSVSE